MTKTFIWLGLLVGSTVGGAIPMLWGGDLLSLAGLGLSTLGSLVGVFVGFQVGRSLE